MTTLIPIGRKSAKEDPKASRERQERVIAGWAKQHPDVKLAPMVWEKAVSGSSDWRDRGFGEVLERILRGEADGIIAENQDRVSREKLVQTAEMWEALQAARARLVCVADGLDTATGDHEMLFTIKAAIAREGAKQMARRTDAMKQSKIASGIHISGAVAFGYRRDPETKKLVVDKATGSIVTKLFERRAVGESYGSLIRWLDEVAPRDGGWRKQTIKRILVNPVYLGEARQGKYSQGGAHDPLVNEELFNIVAARGRRAEPSTRLNGKTSALLAGLACCSECHYALSRSWSGGRWVYRHRVGSPCPASSTIVMELLDKHVEDETFEREAQVENAEPVELEAGDVRGEILARLELARAKKIPYENPDFVAALGIEAATRALVEINEMITALEAELAAVRIEQDELVFPAREAYNDMEVEEKSEVLATRVQYVLISRAPRGTPIAGRVRIGWIGDPPIVRPSRGRRKDADPAAGILPAQDASDGFKEVAIAH
jgi:DNA invertase Pin-like site-specific DNA recombinase